MSKQISRQAIVDAVLDGIEEAQKDYERWSAGEWVSNAAEYILSTYIAQSIMAIEGPIYITIEAKPRQVLKDANATTKGRLSRDLRPDGRIDLLLWWGTKNAPRAAIEVKNNVFDYSSQCKPDIKRIKSILLRESKKSSLKFGVFAFYSWDDNGDRMSAKEKLESRFERLENLIRRELGTSFRTEFYNRINDDHEESAWAAACFLLIRMIPK